MNATAGKTKRALYISAFIPDENAGHAGGQAAFHHREHLERRGFKVTSLICTTERSQPPDRADQRVFRQSMRLLLCAHAANILAGRSSSWLAWLFLDTRAQTRFERAIADALGSANYDLVFCDFTQVVMPTLRAMSSTTSKRPLLCGCVHDLYVQRLMREDRWIARLALGAVVQAESAMLRSLDNVSVLSEKDKMLASALYGCRNVSVTAWTPPRWTQGVSRTAATVKTHEVLFFANFNRPENEEAVSWFLRSAWPNVVARLPAATLVLAGTGSEAVVAPQGTTNLRRTGFLPDPSSLFESCHAAIAPLALGAGVKFKVLEALACRTPVVGTPVALEGIGTDTGVVEATRERFADALVGVLLTRPFEQVSP
jgi:glycosyltransferase involved in cell wall biosynthesis